MDARIVNTSVEVPMQHCWRLPGGPFARLSQMYRHGDPITIPTHRGGNVFVYLIDDQETLVDALSDDKLAYGDVDGARYMGEGTFIRISGEW